MNPVFALSTVTVGFYGIWESEVVTFYTHNGENGVAIAKRCRLAANRNSIFPKLPKFVVWHFWVRNVGYELGEAACFAGLGFITLAFLKNVQLWQGRFSISGSNSRSRPGVNSFLENW